MSNIGFHLEAGKVLTVGYSPLLPAWHDWPCCLRPLSFPGFEVDPSQCPWLCKTTQTLKKCSCISIPQTGFEPMISVFSRLKTVNVSDHTTTLRSLVGCSSCLQFRETQYSGTRVKLSAFNAEYYERDSVNRAQTWQSNLGKHLFLDISSTNTDSFLRPLYQSVETRSIEVLWLLSQPLPLLRSILFVISETFATQLWNALSDTHFPQQTETLLY
jgi:hypothetical protein